MYDNLDNSLVSSKKPLLVDGDNLMRRLHAVTLGEDNGMVRSFFYTFKKHLTSISPDVVVVVFDGGHCPIRTKACPEYKQKRKSQEPEDRQDYSFQRGTVAEILTHLPVWTVQAYTEADDIIGYLIARCGMERVPEAYILSTDKDFAQLIGRTSCDVNLVRKSQIINSTNIKKELGYETGIDFLQMRLLAGDTSDNIKGVVGIGEKKSLKILEAYDLKYGNDSFPKRIINQSDLPDEWGDRKKEFIEAMELSSLLMDLFHIDIRIYTRGQLETADITDLTYNKDSVKELLKDNQLYEFSTDYLGFIEPYLKLKERR